MPVFNIPLDKPRPIRGTLLTEAARLKAKKDKEKKVAAAKKASGITASSQTDLNNAKIRTANRSLIEKTSRSGAFAKSSSLKSDKMTQLLKQKEGKKTIRTSELSLDNGTSKSKLLVVIEPKRTNKAAKHYSSGQLHDLTHKATILPLPGVTVNKPALKTPKITNENFKTTVPTNRNISKTLKVTGLTEAELNKALKLAASKTKNTILKDLTKQMVKKPQQ